MGEYEYTGYDPSDYATDDSDEVDDNESGYEAGYSAGLEAAGENYTYGYPNEGGYVETDPRWGALASEVLYNAELQNVAAQHQGMIDALSEAALRMQAEEMEAAQARRPRGPFPASALPSLPNFPGVRAAVARDVQDRFREDLRQIDPKSPTADMDRLAAYRRAQFDALEQANAGLSAVGLIPDDQKEKKT